MKLKLDIDYDANYDELSDEFCNHDSAYQAEIINEIGLQFKIWSQDDTRTATYVQMLEIAEQLNDNGRWFIKTLREYMDGLTESEEE